MSCLLLNLRLKYEVVCSCDRLSLIRTGRRRRRRRWRGRTRMIMIALIRCRRVIRRIAIRLRVKILLKRKRRRHNRVCRIVIISSSRSVEFTRRRHKSHSSWDSSRWAFIFIIIAINLLFILIIIIVICQICHIGCGRIECVFSSVCRCCSQALFIAVD